jgi:hypothetical protein
MVRHIHKINVKTKLNGMRNWLFSPREMTNEKLMDRLQRCVVCGYETKRKYSTLKINHMVLQIISREDNLDFHRRNRDIHISPALEFWTFKLTHLERP